MKCIIAFTLILSVVGCRETKKAEYITVKGSSENKEAVNGASHPGKKLLESECYMCHNPKASQESMIAPPMIAIKRHYLGPNTTKEEFTRDLIRWVNDPEAESKMTVAYNKFGSMPYIPYPDDAVAQIADYLYDYDIEKPDWFDAHFQQEHGKGNGTGKNGDQLGPGPITKNSEIGMAYAIAAKNALGRNLIKAINEKGTVGAIEFCNTMAMALTDSVSLMNNAIISRVSDKPRNPNNMANEEELGFITYFKKLQAAGIEPKSIVRTSNGEVNFYFPIATNAMCLQCHGNPNDGIKPETLKALEKLYPEDQAIGYKADSVRGLWAISFDEER